MQTPGLHFQTGKKHVLYLPPQAYSTIHSDPMKSMRWNIQTSDYR